MLATPSTLLKEPMTLTINVPINLLNTQSINLMKALTPPNLSTKPPAHQKRPLQAYPNLVPSAALLESDQTFPAISAQSNLAQLSGFPLLVPSATIPNLAQLPAFPGLLPSAALLLPRPSDDDTSKQPIQKQKPQHAPAKKRLACPKELLKDTAFPTTALKEAVRPNKAPQPANPNQAAADDHPTTAPQPAVAKKAASRPTKARKEKALTKKTPQLAVAKQAAAHLKKAAARPKKAPQPAVAKKGRGSSEEGRG